jgi:hypothetical protein
MRLEFTLNLELCASNIVVAPCVRLDMSSKDDYRIYKMKLEKGKLQRKSSLTVP